jgi:MinD-like ATPase involved in chromosome partitioning or flagellar assembly
VTLDRDDENPPEHAEHGVLSDVGSVDTASIGLLGSGTAQFRVTLSTGSEDDLDDDDDVIGDEIRIDELATGDIILEALPASPAADFDEVEDAVEVEDDEADQTDAEAAESELQSEAEYSTGELDADRDDAVAFVAQAPESAHSSDAEPESVIEDAPEVEGAPSPGLAAEVEDAPQAVRASVVESASVVEPAAVVAERAPVPAEPAPVTSSIPATRREAHNTGAHARIDRAHGVERVHPSEPDLVLASKRLGEFERGRESSDLLTADRLLDPGQLTRPEPEGLWQQLVYTLSGHRINLGDGRRARARKELDRRISAPLAGGARFVPVLSRKGGVGKTTVTALLGMALADARDDRVIAVDANPDRGTLADRIARQSVRTVRDLVRARSEVAGYSDISALVARDETRLDVLSSDADPRVSEAFNDQDYRDVAVLAAHYYSLVLTDTGTGIVHSVMEATLELSDQLVVVAGLSVDEARLASETLTWLETNGYAEQVRGAVVVLNNARPGAPLVRESELEAHFRTRVRAVVRVPYDPAIGTGSTIVFRDLQPGTRQAARELAAAVVEGLRAVTQAA